MVFSPDDALLVTGSKDGTLTFWDVAKGGKALHTITAHFGPVQVIAFSPDGKYILTASNDGTARLWLVDIHDAIRAVCGLLTRDLTDEERVQFDISGQDTTCPAK